MAYIKTYQIKDTNSSKSAKRFDVNGKSKTIIFESKRKDGRLLFSTSADAVQEAIEGSVYFENGVITISAKQEIPGSRKSNPAKTVQKKAAQAPPPDENDQDDPGDGQNGNPGDEDPDEGDQGGDVDPEEGPGQENIQYPEVTTFKEAKEVFEREYDIKKTSPAINTPDKIFNKAAELGISFPNLSVK